MTRKTDRAWEAFGRHQPYYGVVSHDRYRKENLTAGERRSFFRTGEEHVEFIFDTIATKVTSDFRPRRAIDFGCGVGRCTIPLASRCESVVGLDVSPSMLAEAGKNCEQRRLKNVEFLAGDALEKLSGEFDLIHSYIVFQHIPSKRGFAIVEALLDRLAANGVGVLQFLYAREITFAVKMLGRLRRHASVINMAANLLLRKPVREPLMEKNCYDMSRLLALLHRKACGNTHLVLEGNSRFRSAVVFFQKTVDAIPYQVFYNADTRPES